MLNGMLRDHLKRTSTTWSTHLPFVYPGRGGRIKGAREPKNQVTYWTYELQNLLVPLRVILVVYNMIGTELFQDFSLLR